MRFPKKLSVGMPHQNLQFDAGYYDIVYDLLNLKGNGEQDELCTLNWKYDLKYDNYFPMLWRMQWVRDQKDEILNSGLTDRMWFGGNEPHYTGQGNESPEEFAEAMEYWKTNIGLPISAPGIHWSKSGIDWWREYQRIGGPLPDHYNAHFYGGAEVSWQISEALKIFSDRPLDVSEFAAPGYTAVTQYRVMRDVWWMLQKKEISSAFWFPTTYGWHNPLYLTCDLIDEKDMSITTVGEYYKYWSRKEPYTVLIPGVSTA